MYSFYNLLVTVLYTFFQNLLYLQCIKNWKPGHRESVSSYMECNAVNHFISVSSGYKLLVIFILW